MASLLGRVLISGYHDVVTAFDVGLDGQLRAIAASACGKNPSYMAFSPDGKAAYACNETPDGRVSAYAFDAAAGTCARVNDAPACGDDPCHVSVHPSGAWVAVANYSSGTVGLLRVRPGDNGVEPHASVTPGKNAHMAVFSRDGARLYVPCLGTDIIALYAFDAATGALTPAGPAATLHPCAGPRHLAFSPDERAAYVLNEVNCTLTSFLVDPATGVLVHPQTVPTLPCPVAPGYSTAHVALSPDGRYLYASNRGHDSLVTFRVNLNDGTSNSGSPGRLECVGWETGGGDVQVPRDFALSPDGRVLVCANQATSTVTVFARDGGSGALTKLATTPVEPDSKPCFVGWVA